MQSNSTYERVSRNKQRNARPPRGNEQGERQPQDMKRGKQWERNDSKRQWDSFGF